MKVKRRVASLPFRSAAETWAVIVKLVTKKDSVDAGQLEAAASIVATAIADEHAGATPIVVKGEGPRLVIYTAHGTDAMDLGAAVDSLSWNPTGGPNWVVFVPCDAEDVGWMNAALKSRASRVVAYDAAAGLDEENAEVRGAEVEINWGALETP